MPTHAAGHTYWERLEREHAEMLALLREYARRTGDRLWDERAAALLARVEGERRDV